MSHSNARTTVHGPEPTDDVYAAVTRATGWLDSRNGRGTHELTVRIMKIGEEFGEATQAWIGHLGTNPRKGRTHTRTQVAEELADVVFSALVALHSLDLDPATVLADRARALVARIDLDDSPTWAGCDRHPDRLSGQGCSDCGEAAAGDPGGWSGVGA